jgi:type VI secretion system secreted protein VgrG
MGGLKSLSSGLFVGVIVAATVFGALVLSVRGSQPVTISQLPIPTATIQQASASPTPLAINTRPASTAIPLAPSDTPTPAPTSCPIPPGWQRYSVGPFDTLIAIAQRFNLTPDQLVQANCLSAASVIMGQTIYVPPFRPTPTTAPCFPPFGWFVYIVQPGDTLSSIAYRYGISLYTLMRANCLSTTYIYYGQPLYVPPIYPIAPPTPTPLPTFTPTPPIGTLTPTVPPTETPTPLPTTPVITDTPGPTDTPEPTATPEPTSTPEPTVAPTDTPEPTVAPPPTEPPPASTPEPPPTENPTP